MEQREAIKEAMREAEGKSQGDTVLVYENEEGEWGCTGVLSSSSDMHPDWYKNKNFVTYIRGWKVDDEEGITHEMNFSRYDEDDRKILAKKPDDDFEYYFDHWNDEWIEYGDLVDNIIEAHSMNILDDIEERYQKYLKEKFAEEK